MVSYIFVIGNNVKFDIRFQSYKSAMNFKFEAKDRATILQQRYVHKFRVLLFEKFTSQMSFWAVLKQL